MKPVVVREERRTVVVGMEVGVTAVVALVLEKEGESCSDERLTGGGVTEGGRGRCDLVLSTGGRVLSVQADQRGWGCLSKEGGFVLDRRLVRDKRYRQRCLKNGHEGSVKAGSLGFCSFGKFKENGRSGWLRFLGWWRCLFEQG